MKLTFMPRSLICYLLALALSACAYAPWQKDGMPGTTPEDRMANARAAHQAKPEQLPPRKDVHVAREQAVYELLLEADRALREGRTADAESFYARVLAAEPANSRALAGKTAIASGLEHARQVEEARTLFIKGSLDAAQSRLHQILLEEPSNAGALALQREIRRKHETVRSELPRLVPPFEKPVTLELRDANIKMVFEALSRTTGINFILDKDIKHDAKATVFIKKARIEDAIEMVLATNGLQKKALSENTALVFPNTAAKLKDYQDLIIRSFYLTNASAKQVASLLKIMLKTKDVYVDDRLNMLVMRDTPEVIRIAEKLVAANDLTDPEVMLEIEVLEVSRSRLQELGIQYPTQLAVATPTGAAALTLEALRNVNSSGVNVGPNPAVNFRKTSADVNLLANPRIRVRNNEKAKVQVGDRVPVITTNVTATVGSSETVQYVDVGLKLEVEPRIGLDDYVNIKVALEVSSLGAETKLTNGSKIFQIGTRNASTLLRLKDGETQVLAGLITDDERKSANKLPGLGDIPLLGRLFSNQTDQKAKTEIVLAITPRILNNILRPESEIVEYWSGTEDGITDRPQILVPAAGTGAVNAGRGLPQAQLTAPVQETVPGQDAAPPQELQIKEQQTKEQQAIPVPAAEPPKDIASPADTDEPIIAPASPPTSF